MRNKLTITRSPLLSADSNLRQAWYDLAESMNVNPSLYPDWIRLTAQSHCVADHSFVVAVGNGSQVSAVFPLTVSIRRFLGLEFRVLEFIGNYASYHNQTISKLPPEQQLRLLINEADYHRADALHFAGIDNDSLIGQHLQQPARHQSFHKMVIAGDSSPYLSLSIGWEEILASKPKKFRYKARQRAKSLQDTSDLRMQWFTTVDDCKTLLQAIQTIEEHSWKKDAGVAVFDRKVEKNYHEMLLPLLATQKMMAANVLFMRNLPIAYNLCCISGTWAGQLKTSFDARHSALSPGGIVIDQSIRRAIEEGALEYDFLGDADPHKLAWSKTARDHSNYYLYLKSRWRGRFVGTVKKLRTRFG